MATNKPKHNILEPRLLSFVTCDLANQTNDGKVNIMGAWDSLKPPNLPFQWGFWIVIHTLETHNDDVHLRLRDPQEKEIVSAVLRTEIPHSESMSHPIPIFHVAPVAMVITQFGLHSWTVEFKGRTLGWIPFAATDPASLDMAGVSLTIPGSLEVSQGDEANRRPGRGGD